MVRGVHHIGLSTPDLDRLIRFYRDLVGFEIVGEYDWEVGTQEMDQVMRLVGSSGRYVMLKLNNMMLEIFQFATPVPSERETQQPVNNYGITHNALDVINIDKEYERLVVAGMDFHTPPKTFDNGALRATYGRDPDGNVVELIEYLDSTHPEALTY